MIYKFCDTYFQIYVGLTEGEVSIFTFISFHNMLQGATFEQENL